jgi:hypothetical protein
MNFNFNPFKEPSADVLAVIELEEAKRQLLAAQSALEYAASMVDYNTSRVARLEQRVKESAQ